MQVAIRVDASSRIGLGHLKRCLALAAALRTCGAETVFVWRDLGVDVESLLHAQGFTGVRLQPPLEDLTQTLDSKTWSGVPFERDVEEAVVALHDRGAFDWIVVDHYGLDARWHRVAAVALSSRVAAIDDLGDRRLAASVVIDHNLAFDHAVKYRGLVDDATRILGGPSFALLGPAYADAPRYVFRPDVKSIGIFLGGTDPDQLSATVLDACRDGVGFRGDIEVASTRANPNLAQLRASCARRERTTLTTDLADLAGFFARHDLQIGAGGGATWERCCMGAPTLALVAAANQAPVLEPLAALGAVELVAANGDQPGAQAVTDRLHTLLFDAPRRAALAERAKALVDGRGAARVARHLTTLPEWPEPR